MVGGSEEEGVGIGGAKGLEREEEGGGGAPGEKDGGGNIGKEHREAAAAAAAPAATGAPAGESAVGNVPAASALVGAASTVDDKAAPAQKAAPTAAASTPRSAPARRGRTAKREADRREADPNGDGGEKSPARKARASRSPVDQTVLWEPIHRFAGDPVKVETAGRARRPRSPSRSPRAAVAAVAAAAREPRVPQAATFEEMMAGIKDKLVAEGWEVGGSGGGARNGDSTGPPGVVIGDDDDAESFFRGEDPSAATPATATKEASSTPVTPNLRKMAEAESIWGPSTTEERTPDKATRRKASGRYRRMPNGQYRSRSVQPPPVANRRRAGREEARATPKLQIGLKVTGDGGVRGPLGKPSAVCEPSVEPAGVTAVAHGGAEKTVTLDVAKKKPRKRGKSLGRKLTGMFRRKAEAH